MVRVARTLVTIVLVLLALGIVMLASTSSVRGASSHADPQYFLKRQILWMAIALVAGLAASRFDYHRWRHICVPLTAGSLVLLVLVLIPGIGMRVGGSYRWLRVGPLSMQPSELAKFSTVLALSAWLSGAGRKVRRFRDGYLAPVSLLGAVLALMILEPDFGTTLLTGVVGVLLMFVAGVRLDYLAVTAMGGLSAFVMAVMQDSVRMGRVLAFMMPDRYPDLAYHLAQSKAAFVKGGWFGVGLGNSLQKQFYLPEAHTDFILAIIGEELGFLATILVVLLFAGILVCGMWITFRARDLFGRLLAFGLTAMLTAQAAINVGVVTGCLPTKGLALPFISYGGSSLVVSVVSIGVLVNIALHAAQTGEDRHTRPIKDRAHRF